MERKIQEKEMKTLIRMEDALKRKEHAMISKEDALLREKDEG